MHKELQKLPDREVSRLPLHRIHEFSVQAEPRRQVFIRHGTGEYAIHSLEELSTLKQQAARNASKATGLSNLSVHLVFNGKPVHDEGAIFDSLGSISSCNTYTLQVALLGGSGNDAAEDFKAVEARKRKERRAASLLKETAGEKRIRLDKRKLNDKKRRENEDDTARQARQAANNASLAKARAGETEYVTKARRAADNASHAKSRAGENEDSTKARQAANNASHAKARACETEEAHARRLELQRPRNAAAAANKRAIIAFISSVLN